MNDSATVDAGRQVQGDQDAVGLEADARRLQIVLGPVCRHVRAGDERHGQGQDDR